MEYNYNKNVSSVFCIFFTFYGLQNNRFIQYLRGLNFHLILYCFIKMQQNLKWSPEEDKKLYDAVKKHGTQWGAVMKEINRSRSQNAIIKRWHGYLKFGNNLEQPVNVKSENQSKDRKNVNEGIKEPSENHKNSESDSEMVDESEQDVKTEKQNHQIIKKIISEEFIYKLKWSSEDDVRLKDFVAKYGDFSWDELGVKFSTDSEEIKHRWIKQIFPRIKNTHKIGGAVKWSASEDSILYLADKNKISYLDLMFFLPGRTVYSIEARWRRISKNLDFIDNLALINSKEAERKNALCEIAKKRVEQKQKAMEAIYKQQKLNHERQKQEQQKYQMIRNPNKSRKDK